MRQRINQSGHFDVGKQSAYFAALFENPNGQMDGGGETARHSETHPQQSIVIAASACFRASQPHLHRAVTSTFHRETDSLAEL
jgi:hypothetical protein